MKKKVTALLLYVLMLAILPGCTVQTVKDGTGSGNPEEEKTAADTAASVAEAEKTPEEILREEVAEKIDSMTLEEKVAQMFVITPEALTGVDTVIQAGSVSRQSLEKYPVGGLIYMSGSLKTPEQTRVMLRNMQEYSEEIAGLPLFLSVDEEGGTVARVASNSAFGVKNVGNMSDIGASGDSQKAYEAGQYIGGYLSDLGFNLDFAPVADVLTNDDNQVVKERSFGSDAVLVSEMVREEIRGLEENGVYACVKHFPGHGNTTEDSHEGYAVTDKTLEQMRETEFLPFSGAIKEGVSFVMAGHISVPSVTGDYTPASLSELLVSDVLRDDMGYEGIVITDAMNMGAVSDTYSSGDAAVLAIQAGVDMILMPEDFSSAYDGVLDAIHSGSLSEERIDESVRRILNVKMQMQAYNGEREE